MSGKGYEMHGGDSFGGGLEPANSDLYTAGADVAEALEDLVAEIDDRECIIPRGRDAFNIITRHFKITHKEIKTWPL